MKIASSQRQPPLPSQASAIAATVYAVFAALFVAGRVGVYGPNHGDVAIWIPMHEWMSRGATLYVTVWDNKDWGFFWFSQIFYRLWGIEGLYLFGFLAVVALGCGTYLVLRLFATVPLALFLSSTAAMIYVAAPSFWSIFTENLGIGFLILGLGLTMRSPIAGGFVWALASSVKIAGAGIFLALLGYLVAASLLSRSESVRSALRRRSARLFGGFVGGLVLVVLLANLSGSLAGWLEVFDSNREYSQIRGFPPAGPIHQMPFLAVQGALDDIRSLGQHQFSFMATIALAIIGLAVLALASRRHGNQGVTGGQVGIHAIPEVVVVTVTALVLTLAQRPSPQHWQYFVGPAVLLMVLLFVQVEWSRKWPGLLAGVLASLLLVSPLIVSVYFDRTMLPRGILDRGIALTYFAQGGVLGDELSQVEPNSSIAFFGQNDERVNVERLPASSVLSCPLIVQFYFFSPRYDDVIEDCFREKPDYVVVGTEIWGTDEWRFSLSRLLESEYVQCAEEEPTRELWVRAGGICPSVD